MPEGAFFSPVIYNNIW